MKKISVKMAIEKYGVIHYRRHDCTYFLMENGDIVDSDGNIRYVRNIAEDAE